MCFRMLIVAGWGGTATGVDSTEARKEALVVIVCVPVDRLIFSYGCDNVCLCACSQRKFFHVFADVARRHTKTSLSVGHASESSLCSLLSNSLLCFFVFGLCWSAIKWSVSGSWVSEGYLSLQQLWETQRICSGFRFGIFLLFVQLCSCFCLFRALLGLPKLLRIRLCGAECKICVSYFSFVQVCAST